MFKKLATAALAATAFIAPQAALAEQVTNLPGGFRYLDREHAALARAVVNAGVSIQVNVGENCKGGSDGVYFPSRRVLAVCQDNAPRPHWYEVPWTANDLDTLRHEAVHILQDCNAGDGLGGYTRLWFSTDEKRVDFVTSALSQSKISWIIKSYGERGADAFDVEAELEAFSVAAVISPGAIAKSINSVCPTFRF